MSEVPKRIWRWWDERPKDAPRLVVVYSAAGEPYPEGAIPYTRDDIVADRIAEAVAKERERVLNLCEIYSGADGLQPNEAWSDDYVAAWQTGGLDHILALRAAIRQTEGEV